MLLIMHRGLLGGRRVHELRYYCEGQHCLTLAPMASESQYFFVLEGFSVYFKIVNKIWKIHSLDATSMLHPPCLNQGFQTFPKFSAAQNQSHLTITSIDKEARLGKSQEMVSTHGLDTHGYLKRYQPNARKSLSLNSFLQQQSKSSCPNL